MQLLSMPRHRPGLWWPSLNTTVPYATVCQLYGTLEGQGDGWLNCSLVTDKGHTLPYLECEHLSLL